MDKITTVNITIPYKGPGNSIVQKDVDFTLTHTEGYYTLTPLLTAAERRIANLPEALNFYISQNRPKSLRGNKDGNMHVIEDAVSKLREQNYVFHD